MGIKDRTRFDISSSSSKIIVKVISLVVLGLLGMASHVFLSSDNAIEQAAERMADDILGLPAGSIDISPKSK